ncbi:hypothetical protein BB559_002420 [Furculomyces boomerangus]|uniref:Peroxisomal multifunctional enzyme type 2-like N-terminal domain-containing protein n=1 Tax=Furculomyces boomerangus TaxID=61424 RepID=A0A2T9YVI0_9FUNG|nr:hypothetical protein BB559_002420 [Furculomyces boomerangus]
MPIFMKQKSGVITNTRSSVGLYLNFGPFIGFLCHNSCPDSGKIFQIGSCWAGQVCRQSTGDKWSVITNFDDGRAQWLTSSGDFNKVTLGNIMRVLNVKIGYPSVVKQKITERDQNATIDIEAARKCVFQPKNFVSIERSIHPPIPTSGNFVCTSQVIDIADKKKASAVTMKLSIKDQSGKLIAEVESSTFIRGIGGFSKVPGCKQPSPAIRSPIAVANASPPKNIHQDVV